MRKYLYLLLAVVGYITLCSRSCSEQGQSQAVSGENMLIKEKNDIKTEFESAYLSGNSLKAFESKAKQKLTDLSDYLNILSNPAMDSSFKALSGKMIIDLFNADSIRITDLITNKKDGEKFSVTELLRRTSQFGAAKIIFDSIKVIEPLHAVSGDRYTGRLAFSRKYQRGISNNSISSYSIPGSADFSVEKIKKSFGGDTLQVWNVKLGTIQ